MRTISETSGTMLNAPTADAEEAEVDRFCEDIIPRTNTHTHIHTHTHKMSFS